MSQITTAMVLAAGLGRRMRPLTDHIPKPMVALGGRPLIDHVLSRLSAAGIARAVVNVHYQADVLERHLATRTAPPRITLSDERDELLDTGGGIVKALPLLGSAPFLVHNSDSVWIEEAARANLDRLIAHWDDDRMDGLLLVADRTRALGYEGAGDFNMDDAGHLVRRRKDGAAPYVFTGVSIAHPRLVAGTRAEPFSLNAPWDRAIAAGRLFGLLLDGFWMHVGTPEALVEAEQCLVQGEPQRR